MREILFRGKRMDNGEWVDGYLYEHEPVLVGIVSENDVPEPSKWFIARTGFADWNMPRPVGFVEVDPSTVGQYTGLKDKNGKRIFEGDIVNLWLEPRTDNQADEFKKYKAVIEFGNPNSIYSWGWQLKMIDNMPFNNDILLWVDMEEAGAYTEVIGNIHDNKLEDFDNGR